MAQEGFYDVRRPNGTRELAAVNPDRKESNLEPMPPETLELWRNTGTVSAKPGRDSRAGTMTEPATIDLWWYVLLAALLLAIVESVIGNRHLSQEKEA